jgi:hypothetical protein
MGQAQDKLNDAKECLDDAYRLSKWENDKRKIASMKATLTVLNNRIRTFKELLNEKDFNHIND